MVCIFSLTKGYGDTPALGKRLVDYLLSIRPMIPNSQINELDGLVLDIEHFIEVEYSDDAFDEF